MRHEVRGYVWKSGRRSWSGQVTVDGAIVHTDGSGSWQVVLAGIREMVAAVDMVANAGCGTTPTPLALFHATNKVSA